MPRWCRGRWRSGYGGADGFWLGRRLVRRRRRRCRRFWFIGRRRGGWRRLGHRRRRKGFGRLGGRCLRKKVVERLRLQYRIEIGLCIAFGCRFLSCVSGGPACVRGPCSLGQCPAPRDKPRSRLRRFRDDALGNESGPRRTIRRPAGSTLREDELDSSCAPGEPWPVDRVVPSCAGTRTRVRGVFGAAQTLLRPTMIFERCPAAIIRNVPGVIRRTSGAAIPNVGRVQGSSTRSSWARRRRQGRPCCPGRLARIRPAWRRLRR